MWILIFADIIDVILGDFTVASLLVRNYTLSPLWLADLRKKNVCRDVSGSNENINLLTA